MDTKTKIINESILLFEKNGYAETSINDIINSLGISKGGFYYHFESKQHLLKYIFLQFIEGLIEEQDKILMNQEFDCKTKIYKIIQMIISKIGKEGKGAQIFFRQMNYLNEEDLKEVGAKRNLLRLRLKNLIEKGIEEKEFRGDLRTDILALGILGICNWSYFWFDAEGSASDEEVSKIYIEMIVNGLRLE
ncbi:TetR/AcrR family transcriptional regulator [Cytobacillus sp. Hz8]|uniref:TetR/AcrR family transcriptional regulator n=1 Tax=Cytobacillus sp. Hz8 TaxID=3347168 RepID=UPI0035E0AFA2